MTNLASLGLRRPQYPPTPDVLQSALAWSFFKRVDPKPSLIFERLAQESPKKLEIRSSRPDVGEHGQDWLEELTRRRIITPAETEGNRVARAITDALRGTEPLKGTGRPAAPLTIATALLTEPSGAMATKNPPNFAQLVNQLFALGAPANSESQPGASVLWYRAVLMNGDSKLLREIDGAVYRVGVEKYLVPDGVKEWPPSNPIPELSSLASRLPSWWDDPALPRDLTPFHWFNLAWTRLCSKDWVNALPPRRWSDWASCVLRQALAFSFLWEAWFYGEIARALVIPASKATESQVETVSNRARGLLPWLNKGTISGRDIKPRLRHSLKAGLACQGLIEKIAERSSGHPPRTLSGFIAFLRKNATKAELDNMRGAMAGRIQPPGLNNLIETVEYSLLCRRETGAAADHYGLTKTVSRRFTHVSPAPEWLVVVASLAALGPSQSCRLADVLSFLSSLGLQPPIDVITAELERVGMCASAPDADEGLLVSPAFGG